MEMDLTCFFHEYIHSDCSADAREKLLHLYETSTATKFLLQLDSLECAGRLKHFARCHGLPSELAPLLLEDLKTSLEIGSGGESIYNGLRCNLQIVTAIKYATQIDSTFVKPDNLLQYIKSIVKSSTSLAYVTQGELQPVDNTTGYFEQEILRQLCQAFIATLVSHSYDSQLESEYRKYVRLLVDTTGREESDRHLIAWAKSGGGPPSPQKQESLDDVVHTAAGQTLDAGRRQDNIFNMNGETLLTGEMHKSRTRRERPTVRTDSVRTQQTTVSSTRTQNRSEKTEIQSISLVQALSTKKSSLVQQLNLEVEISPARKQTAGGSDRVWFRTTGYDIAKLKKKAVNEVTIKEVDLEWLKDKTNPGIRHAASNILVNTEAMTNIGEIFARVSHYQAIDKVVIHALAMNVFQIDDWNNYYTNCRLHLLTAFRNHVQRNERKISQELQQTLNDFIRTPKCSAEMKRLVWTIFVLDDSNLHTSFPITLEHLSNPRDYSLDTLESYMEFIIRQVVIESRCQQLEDQYGFVERMLYIVQDERNIYAPKLRVLAAEIVDQALQSLSGSRCLSYEWLLLYAKIYHDPGSAPLASPSTEHGGTTKSFVAGTTRMFAHSFRGDLPTTTRTKGVEVWTEAQVEIFRTTLLCSILRTLDKHGLDHSDDVPPSTELVSFLLDLCNQNVDRGVQSNREAARMEALIIVTLSKLSDEVSCIPGVERLSSRLLKTDCIDEAGHVYLQEELPLPSNKMATASISAYVATIIHRKVSTFAKRVNTLRIPCAYRRRVDQALISDTVSALCTPTQDKMTRILCSEILFVISSLQELDMTVLDHIRPYTLDQVTDIRVHCTAVYCTQLAKTTTCDDDHPDSIGHKHINWLPKLYALEGDELVLNGRDFAPDVNMPILQVLHRVASRCAFSQDIFHLLTLVLNQQQHEDQDQHEQQSVASIILSSLWKQVSSGQVLGPLPRFCLEAVENAYRSGNGSSAAPNLILFTLSKFGLPVSEPLLELALRNITQEQSDFNNDWQFAARLLLQVNQNQDLDQHIFQNVDLFLLAIRLLAAVSRPPSNLEKQLHPVVYKLICDVGLSTEMRHVRAHHVVNAGLRTLAKCISSGLHMSHVHLHLAEILLTINNTCKPEVLKCLLHAAENHQTFPTSLIDSVLRGYCVINFRMTQIDLLQTNCAILALSIAIANNNQATLLHQDFISQVSTIFCTTLRKSTTGNEMQLKGLEAERAAMVRRLLTIVAHKSQLPMAELITSKFINLWDMNRQSQSLGEQLEILDALRGLGVNQNLSRSTMVTLHQIFNDAMRAATPDAEVKDEQQAMAVRDVALRSLLAINWDGAKYCSAQDLEALFQIQCAQDTSSRVRGKIVDFMEHNKARLPNTLRTKFAFVQDVLLVIDDTFLRHLEGLLQLNDDDIGDCDEEEKEEEEADQEPHHQDELQAENGSSLQLWQGGASSSEESDADIDQSSRSPSSSSSEDSYDDEDTPPPDTGTGTSFLRFGYGDTQSDRQQRGSTEHSEEDHQPQPRKGFKITFKFQGDTEEEDAVVHDAATTEHIFKLEACQDRLAKIITQASNQELCLVKRALLVVLTYHSKAHLGSQVLDAVALAMVTHKHSLLVRNRSYKILVQSLREGVPLSPHFVPHLETDLNSLITLEVLLEVLKNNRNPPSMSEGLRAQLHLFKLLLAYTDHARLEDDDPDPATTFRDQFLAQLQPGVHGNVIGTELMTLFLKLDEEKLWSTPEIAILLSSSFLAASPVLPTTITSQQLSKLTSVLEHAIITQGGAVSSVVLVAYSSMVVHGSWQDKIKMLRELTALFSKFGQDQEQQQVLVLGCISKLIQACVNRRDSGGEPPQIPDETVQLILKLLGGQGHGQLPSTLRHGSLEALMTMLNANLLGVEGEGAASVPSQLEQVTRQVFQQIFDTEEQARAEIERDVAFNRKFLLLLYSLDCWDLKCLRKFRMERHKWAQVLSISNWIAKFGNRTENGKIELAIALSRLYKSIGTEDGHTLTTRIASRCFQSSHFLTCVTLATLLASVDEATRALDAEGCDAVTALTRCVLTQTITRKLACSQLVSSGSVALVAKELCESVGAPKVILDILTAVDVVEDLETVQELAQLLGDFSGDQGVEDRELDFALPEAKVKSLRQVCVWLKVKILIRMFTTTETTAKSTNDTQEQRLEAHLRACLLRNNGDNLQLSQLLKLAEVCIRRTTTANGGRQQARYIFERIISHVFHFSLPELRFSQLLTSLSDVLPSSKWSNTREAIDTCNKLVNDLTFASHTMEKTVAQLVHEFIHLNTGYMLTRRQSPSSPSLDSAQFTTWLDVIKSGEVTSKLLVTRKVPQIKTWGKTEFGVWSDEVRARQQCGELDWGQFGLEALAVAKRAVTFDKSFELTHLQILACLLAIEDGSTERAQGLLQQVSTGSGKSAIIAVLSMVHCLGRGCTVDVYTSSGILAERDAKEWRKFYGLFGITCDHNEDRTSWYVAGPKTCYTKNIVYGDCAQFQFDHLRDSYSDLGTLGGRGTDFAIVDEVDSMFIDDSSKLARLSSSLAGMDLLHTLYHFIWEKLTYLKTHLFGLHGQMYFLDGEVRQVVQDKDDNAPRLTYVFADQNSEAILTIDNLLAYIVGGGDLNAARIYPIKDIEGFVRTELCDFTRRLISRSPTTPVSAATKQQQKGGGDGIQLPKCLQNFAETQVSKWVDSALTALLFQENIHYIVDLGQIKPVDYRTTGVVQKSTNWNNGLHQFLQIKHHLRVVSETVTTNFLSNMAMFHKYGRNLLGFTGTIGAEHGRQVLSEVYNVQVVEVPDIYERRHIRYPDVVAIDDESWLREVLASVLEETEKGRGVLVICETIHKAELVSRTLRRLMKPEQVKLYARSHQHQEKYIERVHPGDVIVATNLAGRGTDIKTNEIEEHGGLHVILTFLPESVRVEKQALGRTSRQGAKGSGQLVVCAASVEDGKDVQQHQQVKDAKDLLKRRDKTERLMLDIFRKTELNLIRTKDELFTRFCALFQAIRYNTRERERSMLGKVARKLIMGREVPSAHETIVLQAVEERWAMFLRRLELEEMDADRAVMQYDQFEEEIKRDAAADLAKLLGSNVFYFIQLGNHDYGQDWMLDGRLKEAYEYYAQAISVDPKFAAAAHIGQAYVLLKGRGNALRSNTHEAGYKEDALAAFHKALPLLNEEMAMINVLQMLVQQRHGTNHALFEQLTEKFNMLGTVFNNIQLNINITEASLRRVHCKCNGPDTSIVHVLDQQFLQERPRELVGYKWQRQNWDSFDLKFHSLTYNVDLGGGRDQALNTIPSADVADTDSLAEAGYKLLINMGRSRRARGHNPDGSKLPDVSYSVTCLKANLKAIIESKELMIVKSRVDLEIRDEQVGELLQKLDALPVKSYTLELCGGKKDVAGVLLKDAMQDASLGCTVELHYDLGQNARGILNDLNRGQQDMEAKRIKLESILRDCTEQDLTVKFLNITSIPRVRKLIKLCECEFRPRDGLNRVIWTQKGSKITHGGLGRCSL